MPELVALDRAAVIDLLVEAHAVSDVFESIAGVSPTHFTEHLQMCAQVVEVPLFGEAWEDENGDFQGPRAMLWEAGEKRARELLGFLVPDSEPTI